MSTDTSSKFSSSIGDNQTTNKGVLEKLAGVQIQLINCCVCCLSKGFSRLLCLDRDHLNCLKFNVFLQCLDLQQIQGFLFQL